MKVLVKRDTAPTEFEIHYPGMDWDLVFKIMKIRHCWLKYCELTVNRKRKLIAVCQRCKLRSAFDLIYVRPEDVQARIDAGVRSLGGTSPEERLGNPTRGVLRQLFALFAADSI